MFTLLTLLITFAISIAPIATCGALKRSGRDIGKGAWTSASIWGGLTWLVLGVGWYATGVQVESWWFAELGQSGRYWTAFWANWHYWGWATGLTFAFFFLNIVLSTAGEIKEDAADGLASLIIASVVAFVPSLVIGSWVGSYWQEFLLRQNQMATGTVEPVFGKDVSFYLFNLPIYDLFAWVIPVTLLIALIGTALIYWLRHESDIFESWGATAHLSAICALLFGSGAWWMQTANWNLLYSQQGNVYGASVTDVVKQIPGNNKVFYAFIIAGVVCFFIGFGRSLRWKVTAVVGGLIVCVCTWTISAGISPWWYQKFTVKANEQALETPYIQRNIEFTRKAFGLDNISKTAYPINTTLDASVPEKNAHTLKNVRLWDWKVVEQNFDQQQTLRNYYDFGDVDVVRYVVDGKTVELMGSTRELNPDNLPLKTWIGTRLNYTHGNGAVLSAVNEFSSNGGSPVYYLSGIPATSTHPELALTQPRIYFGEKTTDFVYVGSTMDEFDYPKSEGGGNATYRYEGSAGIPVGSGWHKFALAAIYEDDPFVMLRSPQLTAESRMLYRRDVDSRLKAIAPFLTFDDDIYFAVVGGKIFFLRDAYTTSTYYPYSEPDTATSVNYIRNSVKTVVDAFTGETTFYIADEHDPIILAYARVYPDMFKKLSDMPVGLKAHLRYPEHLLNVQARVWCTYHMDNPGEFFTREDVWEIPAQFSKPEDAQIAAYYQVMTLPGATKPEFILTVPFSPKATQDKPRNNMVGWLAGRSDGEYRGKLSNFVFPKEQYVPGPRQVGAKINQDENLSKEITLWNQQGSAIVPGNLIVVPLADNRLIQVQPIFLASGQSSMPQLVRVIISSGDYFAYGKTFDDALTGLLAQAGVNRSGPVTPIAQTSGGGAGTPATATTQVSLKVLLKEYKQLTSQGKFAEAGKKLQELDEAIQRQEK